MKQSFKSKIGSFLRTGTFKPKWGNPYATHLPVLIGVITELKSEVIVEFGAGMNSTMVFSKPDLFPSVANFISYENSKDYYDELSKCLSSEHKVDFRFRPGRMMTSVVPSELETADLVFVDDSMAQVDRSATLTEVLKAKPKCVVVHDFEVRGYRNCVGGDYSVIVSRSFLPWTGIVFDESRVDREKIVAITEMIDRNCGKIDPEKVEDWIAVFNSADSDSSV